MVKCSVKSDLLTIFDKIGSHFLAHEHGYRKSVASNPCPPSSWRETKGKEEGRRGGRCECDSMGQCGTVSDCQK